MISIGGKDVSVVARGQRSHTQDKMSELIDMGKFVCDFFCIKTEMK